MLRIPVLLLAAACLLGVARAIRPNFIKMKQAELERRRADQDIEQLKEKKLMAARDQHDERMSYTTTATTHSPWSNSASNDWSYSSIVIDWSSDGYGYSSYDWWYSSYSASYYTGYYSGYYSSYDYSDYYQSYYYSSPYYSSPISPEACMNQYSGYSSSYSYCRLYDCRSCYCYNYHYNYNYYSYTHDNSGYVSCLESILYSDSVCACDNYEIMNALANVNQNQHNNSCEYYYNDYSYSSSYYGSGYNYYSGSMGSARSCGDCVTKMDWYGFGGDANLDHNCEKEDQLDEVEACFEQFNGCLDTEIYGLTAEQTIESTRLQIAGCPVEDLSYYCSEENGVYDYRFYSAGPLSCALVENVTVALQDCMYRYANLAAVAGMCEPSKHLDLFEQFAKVSTDSIRRRCQSTTEARDHRVQYCPNCDEDKKKGKGKKRSETAALKDLIKLLREEGFP